MFTTAQEKGIPLEDTKQKHKADINWPITSDVRRVEVNYPRHAPSHSFLTTSWLTISSLGIIYGDIGTSPLYVMSNMFTSPPSEADVYGGVSLIIWALTMVAAIKYIGIILNFNNNGEGGIFALMAMLPFAKMSKKATTFFVILAIFGSAMLIGDGVITPSISVISAIEGLNLGIHGIKPYSPYIAAVILLVFFLAQNFGTAKISSFFGPIMLVWFIAIGVFGLLKIIEGPAILKAFSPAYAFKYIGRHGSQGYLFLGTIVLAVTGVEALYADLGHFGALPIRWSFFLFVYPSLLLSYIGQGALLIKDPSKNDNPFYHSVPHALFWPMIVLATVATIIASQAIVSGSFSLVAQAINFGYFPRLKVKHTSKKIFGQIYIPELNFMLMVLTLVVTLTFRTSAKLTGAYGLAVSGVMCLTSIIFTGVLRYRYKASWFWVILYAMVFYTIDFAFLGANASKVPSGGWLPLAIGGVLAFLMMVWKTGRERVEEKLEKTQIPLDTVLELASAHLVQRIHAVGIYLNSHHDATPLALSLLLPRARNLPAPAIFLTIKHLPVPYVAEKDRVLFHSLDENEVEGGGEEMAEEKQEEYTEYEEKMEEKERVREEEEEDRTEEEEKEEETGCEGSAGGNSGDEGLKPAPLPLGKINIFRVIAFYGYSEIINLHDLITQLLTQHPLPLPPPVISPTTDHILMITPPLTFYLHRERIKTDPKKPIWHKAWVYFYAFLLRNARGVVDLFNLPYDSIVQVSAPVII
eukprot:Phypoly_transcript_03831.p1 GENE.Phypoly_transcript_03831~~Phypoly_transcript_03831.p1  ORF type:complete len:751 (+),score=151.76 Phypoly_transcript_03831:40-2292(+)